MLLLRVLAAAVLASLALSASASAEFPWRGTGPPSDLSAKEQWMYAATPEPGNEPVNSYDRAGNGSSRTSRR